MLLTQAFRFGLVGLAATAVHFLIAVVAVQLGEFSPQRANVSGFAVAFCVSFFGQWRWTFAQRAAAPMARVLPLYLVVSIGGFVANALAYEWLLTYTAWRFDLALAVVLVAVAGVTFAASRVWVFRLRAEVPNEPPPR